METIYETKEYEEGKKAETDGIGFWDNPYIDAVFKEQFKQAALWALGWGKGRDGFHEASGARLVEKYLAIEKIVKQ